MQIGIPKEIMLKECRVALTPDNAKKLIKLGYTVNLASGAGEKAGFSDSSYQSVGVKITTQEIAW